MNILLTGATGYIGRRLLPVLLQQGHQVICCVRDRHRFSTSGLPATQISVIEVDFLDHGSLAALPDSIDAAYYLIHSMSATTSAFDDLEQRAAQNFVKALQGKRVRQVIYLSGIANADHLSKHLSSRKNVEEILQSGEHPLTTLRAGIIVGSGSASFEIIRDLVEKLPVMVAPKWLNTPTQPIAVRDVITCLTGVLFHRNTYDQAFDIGGPNVLTYRQMLQIFARVRGLKRTILTVPVMTPRLSSYWLYFVTSTSYQLAVNLVNSMKVETICADQRLMELLDLQPVSYEDAVRMAFARIANQDIQSSWKDAQSSDVLDRGISELVQVPEYGCLHDRRTRIITDPKKVFDRIWSIGGDTGWYYGNWLWNLRGFLDKLVGGVGLRRGRRSATQLVAGDALDFWRVLYANQEEKRLLLYAEMKLPGEAWLEFRISDQELVQTATFRPLGLLGRLYWLVLLPFHGPIFGGMIRRIASA